MKFRDIKAEFVIRNIFFVLTIISLIISLIFTFRNLGDSKLVNILLVLPFTIFLTPYLIMSLYQLKKIESKMQVVPRFLRDIFDNVESGTDLVSAIKNTKNNEYGVLNEDVKKLINQLSWGISFDKAFLKFAQNVGSPQFNRDVRLITEAKRVGGHVQKILKELSDKILTENLRTKERKNNLASNTFTGYISFIIFIVIIVMIYNNLFLGFSSALGAGGSPLALGGGTQGTVSIYLTLLMLLTYEVAILSGFLFGLMEENNIISGAPHVVALVVITFISFFFFINF